MAALTSGNALNATSEVPHNIVHGTQAQLVLFLVLNMWPSHLGLPILLAVILFSKRVHRHPTFVNLCCGFILIGVVSCLLLYAGETTGPEPSKTMCLFQASVLYGMPSFTALLAMMLVLQMFLVVRSSLQKKPTQGPQTFRLAAMLTAPYIALLISIIATAAVGASNPASVSRDRRFFYCSVESPMLSGAVAIAGAVFLLATVVLEIWTLVLLYRAWKVRQSGSLELNLPIRVMAFGLYIIVAFSLSLLSISSPESPIPDLVIACAATVIILIFGTQRDILRALCFWRKEPVLNFTPLGSSNGSQNQGYGKA